MEELRDALTTMAETGNADWNILDEAARKWAEHALRTYRKPLLKPALAISEALINFVAVLEPHT